MTFSLQVAAFLELLKPLCLTFWVIAALTCFLVRDYSWWKASDPYHAGTLPASFEMHKDGIYHYFPTENSECCYFLFNKIQSGIIHTSSHFGAQICLPPAWIQMLTFSHARGHAVLCCSKEMTFPFVTCTSKGFVYWLRHSRVHPDCALSCIYTMRSTQKYWHPKLT